MICAAHGRMLREPVNEDTVDDDVLDACLDEDASGL
jgi:hypothetical protein